jgi:hypothetical protein
MTNERENYHHKIYFNKKTKFKRAITGGGPSSAATNIDERLATMLIYKSAPLEVILLETCPALYGLLPYLLDGQVLFFFNLFF